MFGVKYWSEWRDLNPKPIAEKAFIFKAFHYSLPFSLPFFSAPRYPRSTLPPCLASRPRRRSSPSPAPPRDRCRRCRGGAASRRSRSTRNSSRRRMPGTEYPIRAASAPRPSDPWSSADLCCRRCSPCGMSTPAQSWRPAHALRLRAFPAGARCAAGRSAAPAAPTSFSR